MIESRKISTLEGFIIFCSLKNHYAFEVKFVGVELPTHFAPVQFGAVKIYIAYSLIPYLFPFFLLSPK